MEVSKTICANLPKNRVMPISAFITDSYLHRTLTSSKNLRDEVRTQTHREARVAGNLMEVVRKKLMYVCPKRVKPECLK